MLLICEVYDVSCYVDGMGQGVTEMLRAHPEFVRDPDALRRAKSHARFVNGRDGQHKSGASRGQRKRIADQRAAIVTTSGITGGPAMTYVPEISANPTNEPAFTGYQVEGTPGRELLETGRTEIDGRIVPISARVESYGFSAHADREGLWAFLASYEDVTLLIDHGDRPESFAAELREDGYDARAPELDETVTVPSTPARR